MYRKSWPCFRIVLRSGSAFMCSANTKNKVICMCVCVCVKDCGHACCKWDRKHCRSHIEKSPGAPYSKLVRLPVREVVVRFHHQHRTALQCRCVCNCKRRESLLFELYSRACSCYEMRVWLILLTSLLVTFQWQGFLELFCTKAKTHPSTK